MPIRADMVSSLLIKYALPKRRSNRKKIEDIPPLWITGIAESTGRGEGGVTSIDRWYLIQPIAGQVWNSFGNKIPSFW